MGQMHCDISEIDFLDPQKWNTVTLLSEKNENVCKMLSILCGLVWTYFLDLKLAYTSDYWVIVEFRWRLGFYIGLKLYEQIEIAQYPTTSILEDSRHCVLQWDGTT